VEPYLSSMWVFSLNLTRMPDGVGWISPRSACGGVTGQTTDQGLEGLEALVQFTDLAVLFLDFQL